MVNVWLATCSCYSPPAAAGAVSGQEEGYLPPSPAPGHGPTPAQHLTHSMEHGPVSIALCVSFTDILAAIALCGVQEAMGSGVEGETGLPPGSTGVL